VGRFRFQGQLPTTWRHKLAELLIRARESDNPQASHKGDIIIVKPDGWKWGKCECPPEYVVVKLSNVKVDDVKHYEQTLMVDDGVDASGLTKQRIEKRRKYAIDTDTVDTCISEVGGVKEISKEVFDTKLTAKVADGKST